MPSRSVLFPFQLGSAAQLSNVVASCERIGVPRLWLTESFGVDVWSAVASVAASAPQMAFGTAVSLMPLRHPLELAGRLRALAELLPGRFTAGLGVSERDVVNDILGLAYPASPIGYAREYLEILRVSLSEPPTDFRGEHFSVRTNDLRLGSCSPRDLPELMLGALGPRMAGLAAEATEGCITWLAPPALLDEIIVPTVRKYAVDASRPGRVVALVPCIPLKSYADVCDVAGRLLGAHLLKPHYRKMLFRLSGVTAEMPQADLVRFVVDHVVAWGSATDVQDRLRAYDEVGVDEVGIAAYSGFGTPPGTFRRTLELVTQP